MVLILLLLFSITLTPIKTETSAFQNSINFTGKVYKQGDQIIKQEKKLIQFKKINSRSLNPFSMVVASIQSVILLNQFFSVMLLKFLKIILQ